MRRTFARCALLLSSAIAGLGVRPATGQELDSARIDSVFAHYDKPSEPGCAVGVYRRGEPFFTRGYGMADLEARTPITPVTAFHVASISKQFTAFMAAQLAAQGRISLDDDIRKYFPDLPDYRDTIRVRDLIHHTSGLRDELELFWMAGWRDEGDLKTLPDALGLLQRQRGLNFAPGTRHMYVNSGYTLLAALITTVTSKPLAQIAEEQLFTPLGMSHTRFKTDHASLIENRAHAYAPAGANAFRSSIRRFDYGGPLGVYTTIADFAEWEQNFYDARVGTHALLKEMQQPYVLRSGDTVSYAFGLELGSYRGQRTIGHDGVDAGYRSTFLRFPAQEIAIAAFCNRADAYTPQLVRAVADVVLEAALAPRPLAAAPAAYSATSTNLQAYVGTFFNETNMLVRRLKLKDDKLYYNWGGPVDTELIPIAPGRFRRENVNGEVVITLSSDGNPKGMTLTWPDSPPDSFVFRTRAFWEPTASDLAEYTGSYRSDELGVSWSLDSNENGQLMATVPRNGSITLHPIVKDEFGSPGFHIRVHRKRDGSISGFTLSNPRARGLEFRAVSEIR